MDPATTSTTRSSQSSTSSTSSSSSSPPGHHKHTKRKPNKTPDPFDSLPCPSDPRSSPEQEDSETSTFTKLVAAPLLFISFILSLSYVDRQNRSYRVSQHSSPPQSQTLWSRLKWGLSNWWDPEPYQDPRDGTWKVSRESTGSGVDGQATSAKREKWFARKKHRQMASMEVAEAFELAGRMKAVVAGVFVMGTVGVGWGVMKVWERIYW